MKPLQVVFPSRADPESPVIDLDLHLPLLCFRPEKTLQVRPCHTWESRAHWLKWASALRLYQRRFKRKRLPQC